MNILNIKDRLRLDREHSLLNSAIFRFFIFLNILLVSCIIRFYPLVSEYSSHPAGFNGPSFYNTMYIIKNGFLLDDYAIQLYTSFASTIYIFVKYPLLHIFDAITSMITNLSIDSWYYYLCISFSLSIVFFFVILLFYNKTINNIFLLFLLSNFIFLGTPTLISGLIPTNALFGWLYFIILLYLITKHENAKLRILSIFISIILLMTYYTPSIIYLLFLISYLVLTPKSEWRKGPTTHIILYISLFLAYSIYVGTDRFGSSAHTLNNIFNNLENGLAGLYYGSTPESAPLQPYLISTSIFNKLKRLINAFFVCIPPAYFLLCGHKILENKEIKHVFFSYILALVPLTIMLGFWLGIWGIWRLAEWGGLLSLITVSALIGKTKAKWKNFVVLSVLMAVLTSSYAYLTDENSRADSIIYEENACINWIKENLIIESVIFTDMRLAGSLIYEGRFKITGLQEIRDMPELLVELYKKYFYEIDQINFNNDLDNFKIHGENVDYFLFSKPMERESPGIRIYSYTLKPPKRGFINSYNDIKSVNSIYGNGKSIIYAVI